MITSQTIIPDPDRIAGDDQDIRRILTFIGQHPNDPVAYDDALTLMYEHIKAGEKEWHGRNALFRDGIVRAMRGMADTASVADISRMNGAYERSLLMDAQASFDAYLLYVEKNREPQKRFYTPRRSKLIPIVNALQGLTDDKYDLLGISLPPGVGKALANETPVLTRNGWKNHGDLVVGDEVIGLDGEFKKVVAVHPKCVLDRIVTFTNGEQIVCHANHEWMVINRNRSTEKRYVEETHTLETYRLESGGQAGTRGHRYNLMIPHHGYVAGENKELPLDPYTFGVWLGDGGNNNPTICMPVFDRFIMFKIMRNGIQVTWHTQHKTTRCMYFGINIRKQLQSMGMCHSRVRTEKHIPDCYLTASVPQRLELLAGLLDTDGTLCGSKYQFSTTEERLRDSFISLISTFGWRACVTEHPPRVSSSGVHGKKTVYVISFVPDIDVPCALERKRNKEPHKQRAIAIKSINRTEPTEGNCITVEGDGMYLAGHTMIPTHNTTLAIFYLTWMAGKYPEEPMLTGSHSNNFIRGVYDECLRILDPSGEYAWRDVFPGLSVSSTNAKDCRIDIGKRKRFETLEFTSIGTGNAGLYRASRLLYCDDLISGIEIALSKERLNKLWETYTTDLRQRKIGDHCKELHVSTRWSVGDVLGRLQTRYEDDERAKFIRVPAMNENDESNFDYAYGVGFSTEFYREQRSVMDDASWRALYMNEPIEREGLLYHPNELRRYFELPDREPDAVLSVCDSKAKGSDYCVMPIVYQYGNDFYVEDVVCSNGSTELIEDMLVEKCLKHKVQMSQFETNAAGWRIAESVQQRVKNAGGIIKITTKYTTKNKETRIIMASPFVKERCLFKDDSVIRDQEYRKFIGLLCTYSMSGRNKFDDTVDAMALLSDYVQGFSSSKVEVMARPW